MKYDVVLLFLAILAPVIVVKISFSESINQENFKQSTSANGTKVSYQEAIQIASKELIRRKNKDKFWKAVEKDTCWEVYFLPTASLAKDVNATMVEVGKSRGEVIRYVPGKPVGFWNFLKKAR